jgi:hypothetical protein
VRVCVCFCVCVFERENEVDGLARASLRLAWAILSFCSPADE